MIKLDKDLTYFDTIDTEEKAYFLGFLYADGTVMHGRFVLRLQKGDRHILERFSQAIYNKIHLKEITQSPTHFTTYKGKKNLVRSNGAYVLGVYSVHMSDALIRLGCIPRKSLTLRFPTSDQVPEHLLRHFVRGYFDGDGSIWSREMHGAPKYGVSVLSSRAFCETLLNRVNTVFGINFTWAKQHSAISGITLRGNRQVKLFMDWIYSGATISLDRKRARYEALCETIRLTDERMARSASRYVNVVYHKNRDRWTGCVNIGGKRKVIGGYHKTEESAYACQQAYIKEHGLQSDGGRTAARRIQAKIIAMSARDS